MMHDQHNQVTWIFRLFNKYILINLQTPTAKACIASKLSLAQLEERETVTVSGGKTAYLEVPGSNPGGEITLPSSILLPFFV